MNIDAREAKFECIRYTYDQIDSKIFEQACEFALWLHNAILRDIKRNGSRHLTFSLKKNTNGQIEFYGLFGSDISWMKFSTNVSISIFAELLKKILTHHRYMANFEEVDFDVKFKVDW